MPRDVEVVSLRPYSVVGRRGSWSRALLGFVLLRAAWSSPDRTVFPCAASFSKQLLRLLQRNPHHALALIRDTNSASEPNPRDCAGPASSWLGGARTFSYTASFQILSKYCCNAKIVSTRMTTLPMVKPRSAASPARCDRNPRWVVMRADSVLGDSSASWTRLVFRSCSPHAFSKCRLCSNRRSPTGTILCFRKRLQNISPQMLTVAARVAKSSQ